MPRCVIWLSTPPQIESKIISFRFLNLYINISFVPLRLASCKMLMITVLPMVDLSKKRKKKKFDTPDSFRSDDSPSLIFWIFVFKRKGPWYLDFHSLPLHISICSSSKDSKTHGTNSCKSNHKPKVTTLCHYYCACSRKVWLFELLFLFSI